MRFSAQLKESSGSEPSEAVDRFSSALETLLETRAALFNANRLAQMAQTERPVATRLGEAAVRAGILVKVFEIECPGCGDLVAVSPDDPVGREVDCPNPVEANHFRVGESDVRVLYRFSDATLPGGPAPPGGLQRGGSTAASESPVHLAGWLEDLYAPVVPAVSLCDQVRSMLEVKAAGERGDALEHCIAALFAAYPGLFRDEGRFLGPGEKDRVITVLAPDGTVPATWGTKTLYVDCKNEQARYTSAYASVFLTRLREVHGNTGLAVAPAGFTREKDSNAAAVFREAFIRKEALIGTIASADLLAVCETPWWEISHQSLVAAREGTPR